MPSLPKLRYALCNVWQIEIRLKVKSHDSCHTNRHIGIAREINIYLQRIAYGRQYDRPCVIRCRREEHIVYKYAKVVSQYDLLKEAEDEDLNSRLKSFFLNTAILPHLWKEIFPSHNRSCRQLWEERDVECKVQDVLLRFIISPVNIYQVCQRAKDVETDSDR